MKELYYTQARYRIVPERVLHEAEQGPGPAGLRLHVHGPRDRDPGRHAGRCPRQDEIERRPRIARPGTEETRRRRHDAGADAPTEPAAGHESLDRARDRAGN